MFIPTSSRQKVWRPVRRLFVSVLTLVIFVDITIKTFRLVLKPGKRVRAGKRVRVKFSKGKDGGLRLVHVPRICRPLGERRGRSQTAVP